MATTNLPALVTVACLAVFTASCTTTRPLVVARDASPVKDTWSGERIAVEGYVTRDGVMHPFPGFVESVGAESLRFVRPPVEARGLERDKPGLTLVMHRDSLALIQERRTNVTASVLMAAGLSAMMPALMGLSEFVSSMKQ